MLFKKFVQKRIKLFWFLIFSLFFWLNNNSYALTCSWFDSGNGLYVWITADTDNITGNCDDYVDYYKGVESNWFDWSPLEDYIYWQSFLDYWQISNLTGDFFNIYERTNQLNYGGEKLLALLWYNNWLFYWNKNLFIGPNATYIFPFKPVYTNAQYIPIIFYVLDKQLPKWTMLSANLYVTDKDLTDTEENIVNIAKSSLKNIPIMNGRINVVMINIDELRGGLEEWKLYVYLVAKNIYWYKSKILKTYFNYNRTQLNSTLWYSEEYIDYDWKKWTKNSDVNFVYLYTNLQPKTVKSNNDIKVSLSEITAGNFSYNNKVYKYKSKVYLYDLEQGYNYIDVNVQDIYWNENRNTIDVYVDSEWPNINKSEIDTDYKIVYNNKIYINPVAYKDNDWFNMIINVVDEATKTTKVILKTDLGKKIILDLKDWQDYKVKQLLTSFDENGEKVIQIEAYDILGNISKKMIYYNTMNISYPVITFPPKDNLIVVNNALDFKWLCSGVSQAEIKYQLNDNPESGWISYTDSWDINQILKKWYNLFKVKCKNIVGESDWVERIVIYEPKENIGWRNYQLEMYPNESDKFIMKRSNKNADNDTLIITDPDLYQDVPWFKDNNNN